MDSPEARCELLLPPDPSATERLGEWFGARLVAGNVVGLIGELGAGKTTFVRGLARGLGIDDPEAVSSPTYLLVVEHPGPRRLVHADAYLPGKLLGFLDDGGLEYLLDAAAVVVVEWADRIRNLLPANTLWIDIAFGPDGGRRFGVQTGRPQDYAFLAQLPKMR